MALTQELLTAAMTDALKLVDPPCSRWCTTGAEIEGDQYTVFHNGTGPASTAAQVVYAQKVLSFLREQLTGWLRKWVESVHQHKPFDLNVST